MSEENGRGIWGRVAAAGEPRSELAAQLIRELDEGLDVLDSVEPAVTFFGGARIERQDPYYAYAEQMGRLLADYKIPPRTGAGPGIMWAVPQGFRKHLAAPGKGGGPSVKHRCGEGPQPLTQGFNIVLPFEQQVNPAIDVSMELAHFPTRKLMLYRNALGLVIFPGGFGTLDELLEVWRLKAAGSLDFPVVLFGQEFWKPLEDALHVAHKNYPHLALSDESFRLISCTDDVQEAIDRVTADEACRTSEEPLHQMGHRIARELMEGLDFLESLEPAVTVLGGSRLRKADRVIEMAEQLACDLAQEGVPTRAAGPGQLSVALARGGHRGRSHFPQQAFGVRRPDARNLYGADRVHLVADRLTHKVLLTENCRALVALPGGLGTLDELFSTLCQIQTRTISHRQVVLMGTDFWEPIVDTIEAVMLSGSRQTISAQDLDLVTLTDDPAEAARIALAPPEQLPPKRGRG